ncbi:hypothetical protein K2173_023298 [Erythroxylum novogranatense]|uniref:HSF-type DNA-binding domain-containing protein n=1 Tax=Erythroxylum novogranatense TaxID=1862640 RepID=A0AAV8T8Z3_9ROSI|nr:hypothetical protein K2173_023298 [Erythroxylum novogranatense]
MHHKALKSPKILHPLHPSLSVCLSFMDSSANAVPPFLSKTYDMVDDPSTNAVVSWTNNSNSFVVWNVPEFQKHLLPKYFKHNNFSSFVRQLNTYGFRKVDPDRFEFANEGFLRGQKHLLKSIARKKHVNSHGNQAPQVQSSSVAACVEVGKFGLEEEVERLQRDKNVLMQELVRLRQQQQSTDHQLQTVGQRVQGMEQRQQQMLAFLAKAIQSPGFLNQLVQQQNDSNRHIGRGSKKRRLPREKEETSACENGNNSINGQIVKFHSSMNEAAKAMLHQILKMNPSPKLETPINSSGQLLIGNTPSSRVLGTGSTSNRTSGLTLSEVPTASEPSYLPIDSGFPVSHATTVISEIQSPSCLATCHAETNFATTKSIHTSGQDKCIADSTRIQGNIPGISTAIPNASVVGSGIGRAEYIDPLSCALDATSPLENEALTLDQNMDVLVEGIPKLPGINDAFWEQFLAESSYTDDADEFNSKEQELLPWQQNEWNKLEQMNHLSDQMELLTSEGSSA